MMNRKLKSNEIYRCETRGIRWTGRERRRELKKNVANFLAKRPLRVAI